MEAETKIVSMVKLNKKNFLFALPFILLLTTIFFYSCYKEEPIIPRNNAPIIEEISTSKRYLAIDNETAIKCRVYDKDNDKLDIVWFSKRGKFVKGNTGTEIFWQAPNTPGTDTIFVKVSDGKEITNGFIIILVGKLPPPPYLIKPTDYSSEVELSTMLTWKSHREVVDFDLQVSTYSDFRKVIVQKNNYTKNRFSLTNLNSNTNYYWRVKSKNLFGKSKWSKVYSFKTVAPPTEPILLSPQNFLSNSQTSITLTWEKINNAKTYSVQVSENSLFYNLIVNKSNISVTNLEVEGLKYFSTYYWRVKAENDYGISDWSNTFSFSTVGISPQVPVAIFPADKAKKIPHNLTLRWQESYYASFYAVQVSEDNYFTNIIFEEEKLEKPEFEIGGLSNTKEYFWRIKASNYYGSSQWSEAVSFKTLLSEPSILFPENNADEIPTTLILTWEPIIEAEEYSLQIAKDSLFNNVLVDEKGIENNQKEIVGLETFTKYYLRVKAQNEFDESIWSETKSFKTTGFFYKGYQYGNQAIYNPIYVLLNGGFDMIQVGNKRDIKNFPYKTAIHNIWKNLSDPFTPIKNYGWWNFIKDQVLPLSLNKKNAQFFPNYTLHLIGGGMEYAALKEWYEYHKYPIPSWMSAFTVMFYHWVNEVAENGSYVGDDVDPIADLYIFDIGGILLFSSESVKRFFAEDLNLADWSQQPSFSLRNAELHNNGQFFSVKWKFPFTESLYAFYYFGTNGVGGLSYKFNDGTALSVGVGLAASDLILLDEKTNKKTLGLVGNIGVFYDKNNSLLAALSITIKTDYMINLNIYPGLLKFGKISPGLWGAYSQDGNIILGCAFTWFPFGGAYSTK